MPAHDDILGHLERPAQRHLRNLAENLQLVADLGYGDVSLAIGQPDGRLVVAADARPVTAIAALAGTRVGEDLGADREPEAFAALRSGERAEGVRPRTTRGISFITTAYPVGPPGEPPYAAVVRHIATPVLEAPGAMETRFMEAAEDLLSILLAGSLETPEGETFATARVAGDGLLRLDADGRVAYASPNAVNIMRLAGFDGRVTDSVGTRLPGGSEAVAPLLHSRAGTAQGVEVKVGGRILDYRSVRFEHGMLILVQDRTEAYEQEREIKVREATIREVHHRVKNNLQTVASLLRIQARRTRSDEARRALEEANARVSSMAVVHDMLASSTEERIDFSEAARTVVDMVSKGLAGDDACVLVRVHGSTGLVPSQVATSLALIVAELVHNAIEHGFSDGVTGAVEVSMRRLPAELVLTVRDTGSGLPADFDPASTRYLGLAIVRTVVEDDLHGTITYSSNKGTTVTVRFPLAQESAPEGE